MKGIREIIVESCTNFKNRIFKLEPMILDFIEGDYFNWLNEPRVIIYLKVHFFSSTQ
jgi:hypothetical protein